MSNEQKKKKDDNCELDLETLKAEHEAMKRALRALGKEI